jgi:large subunit ribosomal protein L2
MALKYFKPDTPSKRGLVRVDRSELWNGKPEKALTVGLPKKGGRNNLGRITAWRKAGGHKRSYRMIDFKRDKIDVGAQVERIEYDPNRTAFIALIKYEDGALSYILAPHGLKVGDKIYSGETSDIKVGNALPLRLIPVGTNVHNVELKSGKGGQLARAAGSSVQVVGKDSGQILIKLRSGEVRIVSDKCYATIGAVSNADHQNIKIGKAGRSRWMGIKPSVRGVAMNPIDHPHGGGEGKTSGGRHPVTPWGKCTKGKKTRKNPRTEKFIVKKRKK